MLINCQEFSLGNFSRVPEFCLGNLDLSSKLPMVSTLMLHPDILCSDAIKLEGRFSLGSLDHCITNQHYETT